MNEQRAKEISQSPVMANVTYKSIPIYIQHVDEDRKTARIFHLDDPQHEYDIEVSSLRENH